jgi:predicted deacylase
MVQSTILNMTAPLREGFDIPVHDFGNREVRPRAALVGGLHGNELNGVFVLARLAAFLKSVEAGGRPHRLHGRIIILPAVNVLGLNARTRHWPFDNTDINRMFPGYSQGETTQRIADAVLERTKDAYYRIDIHSSNLDFEEFPQVRLYQPHDDERVTACLFGLPVVERPLNPTYTRTLNYAWKTFEGENFVIQGGQAGGLQRQHCERLFRALVAFLLRTGIVEGLPLSEEEEDLHYFGVHQALPLVAERAGLFVSKLETGSWLQAGDVIGQIYDGFEGEIGAEVRTPVAGLLIGIRRQPLLYEGDLLARIETRQPLGERSDTHLHGQGQE